MTETNGKGWAHHCSDWKEADVAHSLVAAPEGQAVAKLLDWKVLQPEAARSEPCCPSGINKSHDIDIESSGALYSDT